MCGRPVRSFWPVRDGPFGGQRGSNHTQGDTDHRRCIGGFVCEAGGEAENLAYYEFCADEDAASSDVSAWRQANPGIGYRLTLEYTTSEMEALDDDDFRRERLRIWHEEVFASVFDAQLWATLGKRTPPKPQGVKTLAVDVTPDRRCPSVAAASDLGNGKTLIEIIDEREGVSWVVDTVAEIVAAHGPDLVLVDGAGRLKR